jgi:hypothetical protein
MVQLAKLFYGVFQFPIIAQPASYLVHLLGAETGLTCPAGGIADAENPERMTFATGTLREPLTIRADGALKPRGGATGCGGAEWLRDVSSVWMTP